MKHKIAVLFFSFLAVALVAGLNTQTEAATDYLDYGLYWYGSGDNCQKAVAGQTNPYYNPSKPVVIYVHGWQKDSTTRNYARERFYFSKANVYTHEAWRSKGWNVGIFYWNQFADEGEVKDAEAKIWSIAGPKGMRYRLSDGSYSTSKSPSDNAGMLFYKAYVSALKNQTNSEIRIVGHSLGNQMATYLVGTVFDAINDGLIASKYMPKRLALLDPAWTRDGKSYLGDMNNDGKNDWVGERCRWWIQDIRARNTSFAVEIYATTGLDLGVALDANTALRKMVCTTSLRPWYYSAWAIADKHCVAVPHYFWSMAFAAPVECTISWGTRKKTGLVAASAATSNSRILAMMNTGKYWDQVEGRYTETPSDDWFEIKSW